MQILIGAMPKPLARIVFILLAAVVLRAAYSVIPDVREILTLQNTNDFSVYYVAATLVRAHQNLENYAEATWDVDPVVETTDPNTVSGQTAKKIFGPVQTSIYDYPPTIADLVVPLTYLGPDGALLVWNLLNLSALLVSVHFLAKMLELSAVVPRIILFAIALLFRPTIDCIFWANLPIILLFLLLAGLVFYKKGQYWPAAFLFALAAAIKLTPLIVIIPLLAWRDWRTVRAIALCGSGMAGLLALVNGWRTLDLFFLHEIPKMSGKYLDVSNRGLGNAVQMIFHGTQMAPARPMFVWASRTVSIVVLGFAYWLARMKPAEKTNWGLRTEVFAIFLLLSCCVSPVSWLHAYVLTIPVLAVAGLRLWRAQSTFLESSLISMLVISLSTVVVNDLKMLAPVLGIAFALVRLYNLRGSRLAGGETPMQFHNSDAELMGPGTKPGMVVP